MKENIALIISSLALGISAMTAWLTWLKRGTLKMTQPTVIFLGPDGKAFLGGNYHPKVFMRTLLYSTSKRGQTIESLYVNVQRDETNQNFSIWVYGDKQLLRGSGLYVGIEGVACDHHFLLPKDGAKFTLLAGDYRLRFYGKRVVDRTAKELADIVVTISEADAIHLATYQAGIYFDWGPDQQAYQSHTEFLPPERTSAISETHS